MRKEAEDRLKNAWQNYCETGDDLDANSPMNKRTARLSSVEDETMLPLPDEVLTKNLGLDTVVVVTKVRIFPPIIDNDKGWDRHINDLVPFLFAHRLII